MLQGHLVLDRLMRGAFIEVCRSLVPLKGWRCTGERAHPYFTTRAAMKVQLQRLALHCHVQ